MGSAIEHIHPVAYYPPMRGKLRLGGLFIVALLALGLGILAALNAREAALRDHPVDQPRLTQEDKAELAEVRYLQNVLGDEVWPGLGQADLPIVLFNDRYEFLTGMSQPPAPWILVEREDFLGQPYYQRDANRPQAFAVPVGSRYAGSISTLERMNREYLLGARRQLPPGLAQLFPYQWATLSRDLHVVALLHELFHAYQATENAARWTRAEGTHAVEKRYPYDDTAFAASWNREGALLSAALKAGDEETTRGKVREFLQVRNARRAQANLAEDLVAFERELEWLEGMGKYVEMRFHELAAARPDDPKLAGYRPGLPHWQMELWRLDSDLGRQEGDFRFYLSGMAQGRLLDRLTPGWQREVLRDDVHLEALLGTATGIAEEY